MDKNQVVAICNAFHLGTVVNGAVPVSGGLIHRMWRIDTSHGSYAIKELDAAIMKRPRIHESYVQSEEIAAALKRQHIPAETALFHEKTPLYETGGAIVMVYPWIEGRTLTLNEVTFEHANLIGQLVATIHAATIPSLDLPVPEIHSISPARWQVLIDEARSKQLSWAFDANKDLANFIAWSHLYRKAKQQLNKKLVISHRDMDAKNVIWRDERSPVLIDWEGAGLINPTEEIINVAMEWAGMTETLFRKDIFIAVINGYRTKQGGIVTAEVEAAFHGLIGGCLNWLEFNMFRSIGSSEFNSEAQRLGMIETEMTLKKLSFLSQNIDNFMAWLPR